MAALLPLATLPAPAAAAVVSSSPNRLDTFIRGADNALWRKSWNGSGWSGWQSLGGLLSSEPTAVASAGGRIDVFIRGADFALWHRVFDGTTWGGWRSLGDRLVSGPAVASSAPGRLDLFAVGADLSLLYKFSSDSGSSWSAWSSLGGQLTSNPAAVSWAAGRIDVFGRGSDAALWHKSYDSGAWQGWQPLGGGLTSGPGVSSWGPNRLDVFVVGTDRAVWHRWWDGVSWKGWQPLGGILTSDPFAVSWGMGRVDAFARGSDGQMWHLAWDGARWNGWQPLGGLMTPGTAPMTIPVPVFRQTMNLDCETAALQMGLAYRGYNYTQQQLFALEKPDTRPPVVGGGVIKQWGDPYTNFVGNVNGTDHYPPTGYGIYYPVILSIAQSHGAPGATGGEGLSASSVYQALASGQPVIVWVEVGWYRPAVHSWTAWDGRSIRYTLDEHTVVLTGVSLTDVRVNDPWHGTQYLVSRSTFETSWADFNHMAIILK
jgi:uncharacterized protein YvpB